MTGDAGFLGSLLCDDLVQHGDEVVCFDNLSTSESGNTAHLLTHERFTFLQTDFTQMVCQSRTRSTQCRTSRARGHHRSIGACPSRC